MKTDVTDRGLQLARRKRALHTLMGNDLCTTLLKSRIRLQKLLNEMNAWTVRPDPADERRQEVHDAAVGALCELQPIAGGPQPSLASAETHLASQHAVKMARWRACLDEQHRRTAVLSSGGEAARRGAQTPGEAVERALADRGRLVARTRVSRTGVVPADARAEEEGARAQAPMDASSDEAVIWAAEQERERKKKGDKIVCAEVFDDSDFYEQLLHEFIRSRGGETEGPTDGKRWADLQQLRSKMKIVANDRASKGRKIRFTIAPKMVNITAPKASLVPPEKLDCRMMSESERENLYRSLFR